MGIDGRGVTTLVAGAGCPLQCRWCINRRLLERNEAEPVTARELYKRVQGDDLYYRATGGGITFGGGEALLQAAFFAHFRALCGDGWRLCAETSLAVSRELVETAAESIDEFIVDCKDMDEAVYHSYTGGDEKIMEDNLRFLLKRVGADRVVVRVPRIPEYNTAESQKRSAARLKDLGVTRLDLFDYVRPKE
ncbi:MAG: radical SAM protein [Lachnospiraceae bacterium]|nr:radical SAM protein [Lachnospiraceae bacterium]